jgi:hypothetical protein
LSSSGVNVPKRLSKIFSVFADNTTKYTIFVDVKSAANMLHVLEFKYFK